MCAGGGRGGGGAADLRTGNCGLTKGRQFAEKLRLEFAALLPPFVALDAPKATHIAAN
jgi:hypothetical protein